MNRLRKKWIALFLVITLFAGMVMPVSAAASDAENYGKLLDSYTKNSSTFTVSKNSRLFVVGNSAPAGELLQTVQLISREFAAKILNRSTAMEIVWGPENYAKDGDILVKENSSLATEAYGLAVTTKAIITYKDVDGLLYGANSLMKFFMTDGDKSLAGFTAADAPDTKERTVMLDTGRKYYTVEWICNFIRQISWMGYNSIQVHVSEDGGFRANFWDPAYYKGTFQPENDFAWLCGSYVQSWVKDPYRNDPNVDDYLTTAELVKICEVAKEYHINIIPSFDSPAHMDYITWKFEQNYKSNNNYSFIYNGKTYNASSTKGCINYTGRTGASSPTWPYYTTIDITDETMAKAFVFALYEDMADFFKEYAGSTKFNIGADEVNLDSSYSPKWSYSQFPKYVNELNRMLNGKGYTTRMFNDFIGSTTYNQSSDKKAIYNFDDNIEILYWNSDFNPNTGKWTDPTWHVKFFWENNTGTTDNWGDGGRTIYNCIQTNTYYVLREGTSGSHRDARDPENRNWTFYGTNEKTIYNNWYPADISEKGDYTEDAADVPANQLGGAYFLIWNDYAALSTEADVWNGALDCWDKDRYYYLFDIMASNIIKMWNSDINTTNNATGMVSFSDFEKVRDVIKTGYFPGYTSCSAAASLPAVVKPTKAYLADHTALDTALKEPMVANDDLLYTNTSYGAYKTAYKNAVAINAKYDATADEIATAVSALNSAKASLKVNDLTVYYKLKANNTEIKAQTTHAPSSTGDYRVDIPVVEGYTIEKVYVSETSNVDFTPNADNTAGTLVGNIKNGRTSAVIWYRSNVVSLEALEEAVNNAIADGNKYTSNSWTTYTTALANATTALNAAKEDPTDYTQAQIDGYLTALTSAATALKERATEFAELEEALKSPITEQGNYTDKTWNAYTSALENARKAKNEPANYTQAEVDAFAAALTSAREALKDKSEVPDTSIESVAKLTATSRKNRPIGILVKTTEDVTNITVTLEGETVKLSNLTNGKAMLEDKATEGKLWLVKFYAPAAAGNYTYIVNASGIAVDVKESVTVTVR